MKSFLVFLNLLIITYISIWFSLDISKIIVIALPLIGATSSLYVFIFRQHKLMLMKSIRSVNDLLIKNNEKFIDSMLHDRSESKGKIDLEKDRKKVLLYLTFLKVEMDNFPCGGPVTSFFKNTKKVKEIRKNLNSFYSNYHECVTLDTIIENPSMEIKENKKDKIIDDVIHASKNISAELEKQLRINF